MIGLGELKDWLLVTTGTDDALLVLLEKRAVVFVEENTGRYFGPSVTRTEYLVGRGTNTLWLNEEPSAVTTVRERLQAGEDWTAIVEADSDGWELQAPRLFRKDTTWLDKFEYEVVYTFGYATNAEPAVISQLVRDLVKLKYDERCSNLSVVSERLGDEQYARGAFTADIRNIPWVSETLDNWRWLQVA